VCVIFISRDTSGLQYEPLLYFKFSDRPFKSYNFWQHCSKILLPVALDRRLIWYPVRGSTFWLISGLPTPDFSEDYSLNSGCYGDRKTAICSPPDCSPIGEVGKNFTNRFFLVICSFATGFSQRYAACHRRKQWRQKIKLYFFSECDFFKNWVLKRQSENVQYVVAAHIEGLRNPPICLLGTIFRVNVPFSSTMSIF
jgi:hypothetical protein